MVEGAPESAVENAVVAQIAAEAADASRTIGIEKTHEAEEAEKRGDSQNAALSRLEAELAEGDAKNVEDFWGKVTEVAIRRGDPLPLTNAERERMWELTSNQDLGKRYNRDLTRSPLLRTFDQLVRKSDPELEEYKSLTERNILYSYHGPIFRSAPEYTALQEEVEKRNAALKQPLTEKIEAIKSGKSVFPQTRETGPMR